MIERKYFVIGAYSSHSVGDFIYMNKVDGEILGIYDTMSEAEQARYKLRAMRKNTLIYSFNVFNFHWFKIFYKLMVY